MALKRSRSHHKRAVSALRAVQGENQIYKQYFNELQPMTNFFYDKSWFSFPMTITRRDNRRKWGILVNYAGQSKNHENYVVYIANP